MSLPKMRYTQRTERSKISVFGGINIREGAREGEIFAGENLSFDAYPALTGREAQRREEVKNASAIYEWNGHIVTVQGGSVMYDGNVIGLVSPGEKQFAVVNTKLIIFPDKVYIDLTSNEFKRMEEEVRSSEGENAVTTENSITLGADGVIARASKVYITQDYTSIPARDVIKHEHWITVYETLKYENGAWTGTHSEAAEGETGKEVKITAFSSGLKAGDLVKLKKNAVNGVYELNSRLYDKYKMHGVDKEYDRLEDCAEDMAEYYAEITRVKNTGEGEYIRTSTYRDKSEIYEVEYRIIKSGEEDDRALSTVFEIGDRIYIEGNPAADPETLYEITGIDDEKRQLTFKNGSFTEIPTASYTLTEDKNAGSSVFWITGSVSYPEQGIGAVFFTVLTFEEDIPKGSVIYVMGTAPAYNYPRVWNCETGEIKAHKLVNSGSTVMPSGGITFTAGTGITRTEMFIRRKVPDMDYICAHDNRLYGVCNKVTKKGGVKDGAVADLGEYYSRVIYVSALGLPTRFYDFEGVDTDSYAVAEASNGDFTACCEYGDYVLFFKEHGLIKFYGSYPSAMGYSAESVEGVRQGGHKSLVIVNDVLYYMGVHGYYAYAGSVPELISYRAFAVSGLGASNGGILRSAQNDSVNAQNDSVGEEKDFKAIAATDGKEIELYISSLGQTYIYSTVTGLWLYGEKGEVSDMCRYKDAVIKLIGGALCSPARLGGVLGGDNAEVNASEDDSEIVSVCAASGAATQSVASSKDDYWEAEFPYYTAGTFGRKDLRYIRVRADCAEGAELEALVKIGEREMKSVLIAEKAGFWTVTVPIAPSREDRLTIKLKCKGRVKVLNMETEFFVGSETIENE